MRLRNLGTEPPAFRGTLSQSRRGAGAALVLMLAPLGACGGETAPTTGHGTEPAASHGTEATTGHGSEPTTGHGSEPAAGHGSEPTAGHGSEPTAGHGPMSPAEEDATEPPDRALITVAKRTAGALTGSDWGAVYDLSCPALVGDQSRESYIAGLSAAGSPAQLAGGTLSAGSPTTAEGIDASQLPVAAGEIRWVQMLQGEAIIGIARFVDAGDGFRYCGLSI